MMSFNVITIFSFESSEGLVQSIQSIQILCTITNIISVMTMLVSFSKIMTITNVKTLSKDINGNDLAAWVFLKSLKHSAVVSFSFTLFIYLSFLHLINTINKIPVQNMKVNDETENDIILLVE